MSAGFSTIDIVLVVLVLLLGFGLVAVAVLLRGRAGQGKEIGDRVDSAVKLQVDTIQRRMNLSSESPVVLSSSRIR